MESAVGDWDQREVHSEDLDRRHVFPGGGGYLVLVLVTKLPLAAYLCCVYLSASTRLTSPPFWEVRLRCWQIRAVSIMYPVHTCAILMPTHVLLARLAPCMLWLPLSCDYRSQAVSSISDLSIEYQPAHVHVSARSTFCRLL